MIVFKHIRRTRNTGDLMSCPAYWFPFDHQILDINDPLPADCTAVVYGGGTLTQWAGRNVATHKHTSVLWGTGSTVHGETATPPTPAGFVIAGTREWRGIPDEWAPCASCMSTLFDRRYPITRGAVLFVNADQSIKERYPLQVSGIETMDNTAPMEEIVPFLGSASIVVTNSYHGVYWATLLGRRVVCVPYSSKFYNFRHPPAYSLERGADWRDRAEEATAYDSASVLTECRGANIRFNGRVLELVG